MEKIGRVRRSQSDWRELVERQKHSGLTVAAFCRQEGVTAASLYMWRSRLGRATESQSVQPRRRSRSVEPDVKAGFIDLGSLGTPGSRFEVRLDLGQGVMLHLVRG
jgi:putative transposase